MITLRDYWMGRDLKYNGEFTDAIRANGAITVARANRLLADYAEDTGVELSVVSSGWRPKGVNDATANSGRASRHLTAQAVDLADPTGHFPRWCATHQAHLAACELWQEDWHWTPVWAHLQCVAPGSGKIMFIPFDPAVVPPDIPLDVQP